MTDASNQTSTKSREDVSIKEYLDASGVLTDDIVKATGLRYTALPDKKTFDMQLSGAAGAPLTQYALFGLSTRCTIIATQNRKKSIRDRFASDADAVKSAFTNTRQGVWGGASKGVDIDLLWLAVCEAAGAAPAMGEQTWKDKVVANSDLADGFLGHKKIGAIYERMLREQIGAGEESEQSVDDLLGAMSA